MNKEIRHCVYLVINRKRKVKFIFDSSYAANNLLDLIFHQGYNAYLKIEDKEVKE